jgi:hydrogenase maturation protease
LSQTLSRPDGAPPRLAIAGVGQALRGDDAAGPLVIGRLRELLDADERLCLVDAGHAPENCLGPIIRHHPDQILFVDALAADQAPGAVVWLAGDAADESGGGTHMLSLSTLAEYLTATTGAPVAIVGIQPAGLALDDPLSPAVAAAVAQVAEIIAAYWRKAVAASSAMSTGEVSVVNA